MESPNHTMRREHIMPTHLLKRAVTLASFTVLLSAVTAPVTAGEADVHCAFVPIETLASGELVTADPVCFGTLAEAVAYATGGEVELPADVTGADMLAAQALSRMGLPADPQLASSAYGGSAGMQGAKHYAIHYTGDGGSGSSAVVPNIYCTGWEYWNASGGFVNTINSTYNACSVTMHYDLPNKGGQSSATYGRATTDTLSSWFKNRTESAHYYN